MVGRSHYTRDHTEIRHWVEDRGGKPARLEGPERDHAGDLCIDFRGSAGAHQFKHIDWSEWFRTFDESDLVMVVQDETVSGMKSRFNRILARESVEARSGSACWTSVDRWRQETASSRRSP